MIFICNFHVLSNLLLIYICKLHWIQVVAYKRADNQKIEGKRIVVDVERGRTDNKWRPMRLGGGKGGRKVKKSKKQIEADLLRQKLEDAARFSAAAAIPVVISASRGATRGMKNSTPNLT